MIARHNRPRPGGGRNAARARTSAEFDALLDGGASGDPRLDEVLSAARGPVRPQELATSAPALPSGPDRAPAGAATGAPSRRRRVLTRLGAATLVTKAAMAAAGAVVVGAAAAGATGHLPGQHPQPAPPTVAPSSTAGSSDGSSDGSARSPAPSTGARRSPSGSPSASSAAPSTTASPTSSAVGSPSASASSVLPALCRKWLALPPGSGALRHEPRFVVLIKAAGGIDAVTTFCRDLPTQSGSAGSTARTPSPSASKKSPGTGGHPPTVTSLLPSLPGDD